MKFLCMLAACILLLALPLHARLSAGELQYQFPRSSATLVSRQATIILRPGPLLDPATVSIASLIEVVGSKGGSYRGRTILSDDRRTVQFLPERRFMAAEMVRVELHAGLRGLDGEGIAPLSFTFTVDATPDSLPAQTRIPSEIDPEALSGDRRKSGGAMPAVLSISGSALPEMEVTTLDNPAPGRLYLANLAFSATIETSPHLLILDNAARPLFSRPIDHTGFDFKRQPDGTLSYFDDGLGYFVILDSNYREIRTIGCGHGYPTDPHELLVLPNGHALLLGLAPHPVDMSTIVPDGMIATVLDIVIQELDTAGNVVFEWRSVDHFAVTDATHEDLESETIDHVHPNSLEIDHDGNILMSSRHLDEVTKIDRSTGEIIWRMGGKHNQFTFTNDPERFSHQHDVRRLANGNIMLFDNGNFHARPLSRAVEYRIDESARTATVVWQYRHPDNIFGFAMGNAQRLPNGNTMIGWGSYPLVTEVRPDGGIAFEMTLPRGVFTYRAFRLPAATSRVKVALAAPADGTTDHPARVGLSWEATGGTTSIRLQLATDSTFEQIVHDDIVIGSQSATVGPLADWTRYWWRVRADGPEIDGVWSEIWSFHTSGAPVYQALLAPAEGARDLPMAPTLHWGAFPGADRYHLQFSHYDPLFAAPQIDTTVASTYLWLSSIQARSRYYWRVRPIVAGVTGNWSQVWNFETSSDLLSDLPVRLVPLAPLDGATLHSGDVEFRWGTDGTSLLPTAYRLEVSRDSAFARTIVDSTFDQASILLRAPLISVGRYWWRASATNAAGEQFASTASVFDLQPTSALAVPDIDARSSSLHPNPAAGSSLLRFTLKESGEVCVRLIDLLGQAYRVPFEGELPPGEHALTLPLSEIPAGTYLCILSSGSTLTTHRLVIAR